MERKLKLQYTTNWRMKYFFWYCLNKTASKFNNSNIGTVNAVQKKFVHPHEMGKQIKILRLIKTLLK